MKDPTSPHTSSFQMDGPTLLTGAMNSGFCNQPVSTHGMNLPRAWLCVVFPVSQNLQLNMKVTKKNSRIGKYLASLLEFIASFK